MATTYTVKKGDTLSEIASRYNTTVSALVKLNAIHNPDYIVIGQVLRIDGSPVAADKTKTSRATINAFGLQSKEEAADSRTMYATWTWTKSNTENYKVIWYYATGVGVWFVGSEEEVEHRQSIYSAPSNATKVKFKVKPISKKKKVNNKEVSYWTADWSTEKLYTFSDNPPSRPSAPTVSITNNKLTARLDNVDPKKLNATHIQFQVIRDDKNTYRTSDKHEIKNGTVSYSCSVSPGSDYKVRCRSYREKDKVYSDSKWSDINEFGGPVSAGPSAPKNIVSLKALSETSVRISWKKVSNATGYEIEYTTKKMYFDSSSEVQSMSVEFLVGHAEITGLTSGEEYFFRVRAVKDSDKSAWTEIKSIIIGKVPAAPTTYSSTTTVITGENLTLYWVHNSEDGSSQTYAELELYLNDVKQDVVTIKNTTDEEEKDKTSSYSIDTSAYTEGTKIQWRVRTAGILTDSNNNPKYGDWSIQRTVDVYAAPTLELTLWKHPYNQETEIIEGFPFLIDALAEPSTQKPTGFHLAITANEAYETVDNIGNRQMINKGEAVYSNYFDTSEEELWKEFTPSDINLENNITYTVTCTVSMNSGLTAESTLEFTVAWSDIEYEPNAEIAIDKETLTASIRPYIEDYDLVYSDGIIQNTTNNITLIANNGGDTLIGVYRDKYICRGSLWDEVFVIDSYYTSDHKFNAVCPGSDESDIVFVGNYGTVFNGNRGSFIDTSISTHLNCIAYGGGRYVTIGSDGGVYYSTDTYTWTECGLISMYTPITMTYGNGVFIAVCTAGIILYSTDGSVWNTGSSGTTARLTSVAYGNNKFIAVGNNGIIISSEDGITWNKEMQVTIPLTSVTYGNGRFIVVGEGDFCCYLPDGSNWQTKFFDERLKLNCIAYGRFNSGNFFVAVGDNEIIAYSEDGRNWVKRKAFTRPDKVDTHDKHGSLMSSIAYGDDKYVAVGTWNSVMYSTDGINWIESEYPSGDHNILGIIYTGDKFVTLDSNMSIYQSEDGIKWELLIEKPLSKNIGYAIFYYDDKIIVSVYDAFIYSEDGITWKESIHKVGAQRYLVYDGEKYLFRESTTRLYHCPKDLSTWTKYSIPWLPEVYDLDWIVYGDGKFVRVGHTGCITYSEDGYEWYVGMNLNTRICDNLYSVEYGDGKFVIAGENCILYSEDGITWEREDMIIDPNTVVDHANGTFFMLGYENTLKYSHYKNNFSLSVYRREFDGKFTEIATDIDNIGNTFVTDPHPALDLARYRIVATSKTTGAVSFYDVPGYPVGEKAVIIQWDEDWTYFDTTNEDAISEPPWTGSMLKLPYNIDVSNSYSPDVELAGYIGREHPVSYYGTQRGESASWSVEIDKKDEETLYAIRRLAIWLGDVYVREPSGSGYWAQVTVSFSQTHCETTIPVTFEITRVEGGV